MAAGAGFAASGLCSCDRLAVSRLCGCDRLGGCEPALEQAAALGPGAGVATDASGASAPSPCGGRVGRDRVGGRRDRGRFRRPRAEPLHRAQRGAAEQQQPEHAERREQERVALCWRGACLGRGPATVGLAAGNLDARLGNRTGGAGNDVHHRGCGATRRRGDGGAVLLPGEQRRGELARVLEAVCRLTRHRLVDQAGEGGVHVRGGLRQRRRVGEHDLEQQLVEGGRVVGHGPGDRLVQDHADGVDVAARVRRHAAVRLFRRHVVRRAHDGARLRHLHLVVQGLELRDAEIDDLHVSRDARLSPSGGRYCPA